MREMGVDAKKISVGAGQFAVAAIRACLTSLSHHPFAWFLGFYALFLYRFFPSLFHFLLSSAPVLVCTAVLLGTLLSLGQPNIPEIEIEEEEEKTSWNASAFKSPPLLAADNRVLERDGSLSVERSEEPDGEKEEDGGSKSEDLVNIEDRGLDQGGLIEFGIQSGGAQDACIAHQSDEAGGVLDEKNNSFPHDSSWKGIDSEEDSDSGSDEAESLSPDASLTDIMPMLDELHPLLDVDAPQPATHSPKVTDEEDSDMSADDDESDSGSEPLEEEEEIQDEEEEGREDQEDRASEVVTWTEDDEKNLKDIKKLELERNLKMENMIAKRIASRNQRAMADMNLIDLDGIHLQIPPVSTSKQNPFDLPDTAEKNLELPPVPGSAPSVLHPRVNPFDLPDDQLCNVNSRSVEESSACKDSVTFPQREPFFRRHETFHLGTSFSGEITRETDNFKPYFVVEAAMPEETSISPYQRQMSDLSESKVSSVNEVDTNSSDLEEEQMEMLDDEPQLEFCSASPCVQNVEHLNGRDSSEEGSLDSDEEHVEKDVDAVDTIVDGVEDEVDTCQPGLLGEKYIERSSTSLSEESDKSSSPEKAKDEPSKWSSDSVHSSMTETEKPEEATAVEPVYDSSPSALEKSISNITDIEALFNPDKGDINSASALSTTHVMIADRSSPLQEKEQIDESIESGKLKSSQELHLDMADLPRQDMTCALTMFKDYTDEEVYEPEAKSSITNMETVDSRLTGDLVSSCGSAESTEIFMEKNAEADGLQEIDEYLLKELDAVGDFNVQSDSHVIEADIGMQSSQGVYKENMIIGESVKMKTSTSTSTEENSISMLPERDNDASSSLELNSQKSTGQDAVVTPTFDSTERERSSIKSSDINYHGNDLVVLDASSVEDIDTVFTRIKEEVQKSKSILHEPLDENSAVSVATGDLEVSHITDTTVVDEISSSSEDDIEEGGGAPSSVFKPKKTEVVSMSSSEPNNCHNGMDVVEARSLEEDIDLAFSKMRAEVIAKSADQKSMHVATKPELQVVSVASVADLSFSPQAIEQDTATSTNMNSHVSESDGSSTQQDEKHEELHSRIQCTEEPEIGKQNSDNMEMASHAEGTKDDKLQQRKSEVDVETIVLTVNVVQQADSANREILERPDEIENTSSDLHSTKSGKMESSSSSPDSSSSISDSE